MPENGKTAQVNMLPEGPSVKVQLSSLCFVVTILRTTILFTTCVATQSFATSLSRAWKGHQDASVLHGNPLLTMSSNYRRQKFAAQRGSSGGARQPDRQPAPEQRHVGGHRRRTVQVPLRRLRWRASRGHAGIGFGFIPTGGVEPPWKRVLISKSRISPKYIDKGGVLVLNQKCIRDFAIDTTRARRHDPAQRSVKDVKSRSATFWLTPLGWALLAVLHRFFPLMSQQSLTRT